MCAEPDRVVDEHTITAGQLGDERHLIAFGDGERADLAGLGGAPRVAARDTRPPGRCELTLLCSWAAGVVPAARSQPSSFPSSSYER